MQREAPGNVPLKQYLANIAREVNFLTSALLVDRICFYFWAKKIHKRGSFLIFHSIYEQIFPVLPSFRSGSNPGMAVFLLARVDLVKMSVDNNSYFQRGDDRQPPSAGGSGHWQRYLELI